MWRIPFSTENHCLGSHSNGEVLHCARKRVDLYAEQDHIIGSGELVGGNSLRVQRYIPEWADDLKPFALISSARLARTRNVTSRFASARRPPKYPPTAPAPTTRICIVEESRWIAAFLQTNAGITRFLRSRCRRPQLPS
jgi:hypothetical protein